MKLVLSIGVLFAALSFNASAGYRQPPSTDQMTCRQAQAFVKKYNRYYKNVGVDGAVPIYPVTSLEKTTCGGRYSVSAEVAATLDNRQCVVGYYCRHN